MSSSETQTAANRFRFLAEAAAWRYRAQGFAVRLAVRKALLRDPFYRELLAPGRLPPEGLVLELGCGRGVLLALLACAPLSGPAGARRRLMGVEPRPAKAESARLALAGKADIVTADLCEASLPPCRAVILLDALYRLEPARQDALLERVAAALEEGGQILLREPDAGSWGCRAGLAVLARAAGLLGGGRGKRFYPRSGEQWRQRLEALGLRVGSLPASGGTGFARVLLTASKAPASPS